jgi:Asp-tRNA(Asn)/Glu-tRNA(Gln) amidotransferase A subunit family amidase
MSTIDLDLCYMTATEAIAAFKARKLSPVELMKAVVARAEEVNPALNAISQEHFDRALKEARQAEERYLGKKAAPRQLEGVPIAIKDFHMIKDEITTFGSKVFEYYRATSTAPTVNRLLKAGAIMHLRSTTPEFASSATTHSPLWGVTRNPWNRAFSPGGSTGGGAAAVAAGFATIADGTDGGGSIRIPASACGLVGYLAPFGRNPLDSDHPVESLLRYGPVTRSVADAALMQNVMSGPHPDDMCSLRDRLELPDSFEAIRGWKIALSLDLGYFSVDPEVLKAVKVAAKIFETLGCQVTQVSLDWNIGILEAMYTHWEGMAAAALAQHLPRWRYEINPHVVHLIEKGLGRSAADLYSVNYVRGNMYRSLESILKNYDVLICPTLAIPSVAAEHNNLDPNFVIDGKRVDPYLQWAMTYPFNLVSQVPAISVPCGTAQSGVPIGLQIVGKTYDDLSVFRAAAAFEKAMPWRARRPEL